MTKAATVTVPMSLRLGAGPAAAWCSMCRGLRQLLLPLAPFPALILQAALEFAFLLGHPQPLAHGSRGARLLAACPAVLGWAGLAGCWCRWLLCRAW